MVLKLINRRIVIAYVLLLLITMVGDEVFAFATDLPGQVISAGQTTYTLCEHANTIVFYDPMGYVRGTNYGKINRGEQFSFSVPVPKAPQWIYWRLSLSSQALGSGALGSLRVNGCDAIYTAPANNEYVGGSLPGVDIFATYGHDPTPTPSPTPTLTPCPAPSPTPTMRPGGVRPGPPSGFSATTSPTCAPSPEVSNKNLATGAETGPRDVGGSLAHYVLVIQAPLQTPSATPAPIQRLGSTSTNCSATVSIYVSTGAPNYYGQAGIWIDGRLMGVNQFYSKWSQGAHKVFIQTRSGRILLNRIYNVRCGVTLIKFT